MAVINGKNYTKQELFQRFGNLGTIAGIRRIRYTDGLAEGLMAYDVVNGPLRFTILAGKCMDIGEMYYNGSPVHFHAHPGVVNGERWYDGPNAPRSIMGGMLFTCGLGNVGPIQTMPNGQTQPQHGFIRNTPAELHGARTYWEGDDYYLELTGVMRESSLFGTSLTLTRTITSKLGESKVHIHDRIENESTVDNVPLMLMYHFNVGFPFLSENAAFYTEAESTLPRDEIAREGMKEESPFVFGAPVDCYSEQVFYHKPKSSMGRSYASMRSPDTKTTLVIDYDSRELPNLIQWKCRDAGNYVTGIEPSNCYPEGVIKEDANKTLRRLAAGEILETDLILSLNHEE